MIGGGWSGIEVRGFAICLRGPIVKELKVPKWVKCLMQYNNAKDRVSLVLCPANGEVTSALILYKQLLNS